MSSAPDQNHARFPVTRVVADAAGTTRFEDGYIHLSDGGPIGLLSDPVVADQVVFRSTGADYDYDWHPAPRRQFILMMSGAIEIETGDGSVRRFSRGDTLLLEDLEPPGHRTRNVGEVPRYSVFIQTEHEIPFTPSD